MTVWMPPSTACPTAYADFMPCSPHTVAVATNGSRSRCTGKVHRCRGQSRQGVSRSLRRLTDGTSHDTSSPRSLSSASESKFEALKDSYAGKHRHHRHDREPTFWAAASRRARRSITVALRWSATLLPKIKMEVVVSKVPVRSRHRNGQEGALYRPYRRRQDLRLRCGKRGEGPYR